MPKFKIKDVESVRMAYVYEVEAETKEEALDKYVNELAGGLEQLDCFVTDDSKESITVMD
jgi:hypothetical protein